MRCFSHRLCGLSPMEGEPLYSSITSSNSESIMEGSPSGWVYHSYALNIDQQTPYPLQYLAQEGKDPIYYPNDQTHLDFHPSPMYDIGASYLMDYSNPNERIHEE